jgi:hypothetical protein
MKSESVFHNGVHCSCIPLNDRPRTNLLRRTLSARSSVSGQRTFRRSAEGGQRTYTPINSSNAKGAHVMFKISASVCSAIFAVVGGTMVSPVTAQPIVGVAAQCPSRPHRLDAEVPRLKGRYLTVRDQLVRLGFAPYRLHVPSRICVTTSCRTTRTLPEAQCAVDGPVCNMYWRAPDKRILQVGTCGDEHGGIVDSVRWAPPIDPSP